MDTIIKQDLNSTVDVITSVKSDSDAQHLSTDELIDNVAAAIEDVEYDDVNTDDDDVDSIADLGAHEIEFNADSEEDAAEIEIMSDDDYEPSKDDEESEGDEVVDDEVIDVVKEAFFND